VSEAKTTPDKAQTKTNGKDQPKPAGDGSCENLDELRAKAAERDQFKDLAQRARAEFENYQKRNQRDREQ
jgi:molecular chaperone GrpE (heat shock protein)